MRPDELQRLLNALGMAAGPVDGSVGPMTRTAVARFQLACALPGHHLVVDGTPGPRTYAALEATRGIRLSPNFAVAELRTRTRAGGPKDGDCWVHRDLLRGLETLRAEVGRPLPVVSGFRDDAHNRRVGGASRSQHTYGPAPELVAIRSRLHRHASLTVGRAADIPRGYAAMESVRALRLFAGIGHAQGWATHVDVRPGDPTRPTVWRYG